MQLYIILGAIYLVIANLVLEIPIYELRNECILFIFVCIYSHLSVLSIYSQLWDRRPMRKTFSYIHLILFAIITAVGSGIGIAVTFFIKIPNVYVFKIWASFFLSLAIQDSIILWHSLMFCHQRGPFYVDVRLSALFCLAGSVFLEISDGGIAHNPFIQKERNWSL